jgi:hypothetical protein
MPLFCGFFFPRLAFSFFPNAPSLRHHNLLFLKRKKIDPTDIRRHRQSDSLRTKRTY